MDNYSARCDAQIKEPPHITYSRELHKIKGSQRSQAGTDDVEYSTWVIFSSLDVFLHPHVTMRASISWCILNMQLPPKANGDLHASGRLRRLKEKFKSVPVPSESSSSEERLKSKEETMLDLENQTMLLEEQLETSPDIGFSKPGRTFPTNMTGLSIKSPQRIFQS